MMTLTANNAWQRARAIKLHEHFKGVAVRLEASGVRLGAELERVALMLDGRDLAFAGGSVRLKASLKTIIREWYRWRDGGKRADALLLRYKAGCGGNAAVPAKLIAEIHRRATLATGARDKHKRSPMSVVYKSLCEDFMGRKPLPGIDYADWPEGAESHDAAQTAHVPAIRPGARQYTLRRPRGYASRYEARTAADDPGERRRLVYFIGRLFEPAYIGRFSRDLEDTSEWQELPLPKLLALRDVLHNRLGKWITKAKDSGYDFGFSIVSKNPRSRSGLLTNEEIIGELLKREIRVRMTEAAPVEEPADIDTADIPF